MKLYSVAISQTGNEFFAQVPDLPEISVTGESIADAIDKVRSAIIGKLQEIADSNQPIPQPENITTYLTNPKFAGQTWAIVSLDSLLFANQSLAISVNVPRTQLEQIREYIRKDSNTNKDTAKSIEDFILNAITNELAKAKSANA